jgi:Lar family restriction alleviation protein
MSEPKLLGCPFCGKQPRSATHLSYSNYGVICDCGAVGPTFNAGYRPLLAAEVKAVHDAIEAWNTRAHTPPAEVTVTNEALQAFQRFADYDAKTDCYVVQASDLRPAIAAALAARGK